MTREEAIKKLKYLYFNGKALSNSEEAIRMGIEALEEQGKNYFRICRKCFSSYPFEKMFNFCPNCGAKIVEPQAESEENMTITIPNNATNADVLKILYPNADLVGVCMVDKHMNVIFRDLNYYWLQSLYNEMAELESEE